MLAPRARIFLSDSHAPFEHPDAYSFFESIANQFNVADEDCYHVGDEGDFHGMSLKFAADPDGYSPGHEYQLMLESMHRLYKIFPKMKVCRSNHTWRPFKKAFAAGIPGAFLRNVKEFMQAPKGWEWADQWIAGKTLVIHGEGYSSSSWPRAMNAFRQSVIMGHCHAKPGVVYSTAGYGAHLSRVFTMQVGCVLNLEAYSAAYGKTIVEKPVLGCGVTIDDREAFFIPMPNQNGVVNKIAKGLLRP